jgi:hypothetical protein
VPFRVLGPIYLSNLRPETELALDNAVFAVEYAALALVNALDAVLETLDKELDKLFIDAKDPFILLYADFTNCCNVYDVLFAYGVPSFTIDPVPKSPPPQDEILKAGDCGTSCKSGIICSGIYHAGFIKLQHI